MTAINTPVRHGQASRDFRRGLLVGAAAAALLAASMIAAAFGAGVIGTTAPEAAAPAAPAVEAYVDLGLRAEPATSAVVPSTQEQFRPVAPGAYTSIPSAPAAPIDVHNPFEKGPIRAY